MGTSSFDWERQHRRGLERAVIEVARSHEQGGGAGSHGMRLLPRILVDDEDEDEL